MNNLKEFFERFQKTMEDKVVPVASKIASQRHLSALRDGLTILIPLTVIGGISLMLANPPVDLETMKPTNVFFQFLIMWKQWANCYADILTIPFNLTIGIISIYVVLGVSYRLSQSYEMEAFPNSITSLFTFLCVAGVPVALKQGNYIDVSNLGAGAMFTAIIIALLSIEINHFMIEKNIKIKMPAGVPPMVAGPFEVLLPMVVNILVFTGNLVANLDAYNAGKEIPNIIAGNFTFIFGLAIVYLAILFNLNFVCKNKRLRSLGKLAIPSSLFNINEPLVFGVPTVLNILTFIPSLICVAIDLTGAYLATSVGFMAKTCMSVPWTLPAPLYAFISTMDYKAIIVWVILFIINVIIFVPFMKSYDKQMNLEEQNITQAE